MILRKLNASFVNCVPILPGRRFWPPCRSFSPFRSIAVRCHSSFPSVKMSANDPAEQRVRSFMNGENNTSNFDDFYSSSFDSLDDDSDGVSSSELDLLLGPDASEEAIMAQNRMLFPDDDTFKTLEEAEEVTIKLPVGAVFEQLPSGELFIDEIMAGSNAEKTGLLHVGDVIIGHSLPYGTGTTLLPKENPLDSLESFIGDREEEWITFVVRRGADVEELRRSVYENEGRPLSGEQIQKIKELANSDWYPFCPGDDEDEPSIEDNISELRREGFNMDVEVGYTPSAEEIDRIEKEAKADVQFADLDEDEDEDEDVENDDGMRDSVRNDDFVDEELKETVDHWKGLYEKGRQGLSNPKEVGN